MSWIAASNLVGAAIYAARVSGLPCAFAANSRPSQVPERWVRLSYDIRGSSYQIFHGLVVLAALLHLCGLAQAPNIIRATADDCRL
jgi:adiponectin receptor